MKKCFRKVLSLFMVAVLMVSLVPVMEIEVSAFTIRDSAPASNNQYYRHTSVGGLNEAIHISGGSVLPNCVGYAWGRAYEITGNRPTLSTNNANTFWGRTSDGYARGQTPRVGAIACWNNSAWGHVAVVERVEGDRFWISESHYLWDANGNQIHNDSFRFRYLEASKSTYSNFQGFIYLGNVPDPLRSADIPNGVYTIQSRSTGRFIDIRDGSTGNGAVAQIWERATINQSFRLQRQDDHTYSITAVHSGKVLEVVNVSTESGAMIQQWEWVANSNNNQRWYIIDVGGGYYKFVNKHSRLVLDVVGGVNANGTRLQQYGDNGTHAQHFRLLAPLPATSADIADGVYAIQSRSTSRFIDIRDAGTGNGAIAQIWERDYNAQNQLFRLQRQSDSSYSITAIHSGRVLDVVDGNINARATIQQWQWTGNNAQRWYIVDVGGGYYKFIAKHSGLALDIAYGVNANGTRLQQFTDNGTPAQQFRFVPHIVSCECGNCEECGIITILCECGDCEECGFVPDNLYISSLDFIENGGWLELRNSTDSAISCKGLYLSNDGDDLLMWQMPAVIVRAGETVRVRASGNDVCVALKRMTANFDFSAGDILRLSNAHGGILFEIMVE